MVILKFVFISALHISILEVFSQQNSHLWEWKSLRNSRQSYRIFLWSRNYSLPSLQLQPSALIQGRRQYPAKNTLELFLPFIFEMFEHWGSFCQDSWSRKRLGKMIWQRGSTCKPESFQSIKRDSYWSPHKKRFNFAGDNENHHWKQQTGLRDT